MLIKTAIKRLFVSFKILISKYYQIFNKKCPVFLKKLLRGICYCLLFYVLLFIVVPKPKLLENITFSKAVYDKNMNLMRLTLAEDDIYRLYTPLDDISEDLKKGVVLYEDKYFKYHFGFNPIALFKAFYNVYIKKGRHRGGSTITMQLARMLYDIDSTSVLGKLYQIIKAVQIEIFYSKNEILEAYLNLTPYGHNIEGAGAASLIYFNQRAKNITFEQSLALSVIPQDPNGRMPTIKNGYSEMIDARDRLFSDWIEIYEEDKMQKDFLKMPLKIHKISEIPFHAPHFTDDVLNNYSVFNKSEIVTTFDLKLYQVLNNILKNYVKRKNDIGIYNASALLINWQTMEQVVLIGSADFFNKKIEGQVNGVNAKRSPGSALKPFIYALALDQSIIHPMTMLKDLPKKYGIYSPENFDEGFLGPISATDALIKSRNVPAVDLLLKTGKNENFSFYDLLKKFKISNLKEESFYGLSLALGGFEISMKEMVKLYAYLRNLGKIQDLKVYNEDKIFSDENKDKDEDKCDEHKKYISSEALFLTLKMLEKNPEVDGLKYDLIKKKYPVYWKTGTSYAFRDAWAVGIFGPYVLSVWVGNFDSSSNPSFVGRTAAAPLFFELIRGVEKNTSFVNNLSDYELNPVGLNVKKIKVCKLTGDIDTKYCPDHEYTWFIPGVSPIKSSNIYRKIPIDKKTGLRACSFDNKNTMFKIYEFWPTDLLELFKRAGIYKKIPPKYNKNCSLNTKSYLGNNPEIILPAKNIVYTLRDEEDYDDNLIPFKASLDSDADEVYWFLDNQYIGNSKSGEMFFYTPSAGDYNLKAVDDMGRSSHIKFKVRVVK